MPISEAPGKEEKNPENTQREPGSERYPFVSVAIRSFRRIPQLAELVEQLLEQDYPNFEIVIVEQSSDQREVFREQLSAIGRDERVRLLYYPPLGAGYARNEVARQSRGEIVIFIDDDDLPLRTDWISAHVANFKDPLCIAVSGRQVRTKDENPTPHNTRRNRRLCLRYSFFLMPRGRVAHTTRIQGVTQVAGTNASIRASAIERTGGWDPEDDHDEDSFSFRFARVRTPGEYFVYDPLPVIVRRLHVEGGIGRRQQDVSARLRIELIYSHRVIRRYFPARFYAFYPVYLWLAASRAVQHVKESRPQLSIAGLVTDVVRTGPAVYRDVLREILHFR